MIVVYVESNFVLELALGQEGADDAAAILRAAVTGDVALAIPMFSLCEPYGTVTHRARDRQKRVTDLEQTLRDLQRNAQHQALVDGQRAQLAELIEVARREWDGLERTIRSILEVAIVLPLTLAIHEDSIRCQRVHGLDESDALVYATILADAAMRRGEVRSLFVTTNSKDFNTPSIGEELGPQGCDPLFSFAAVLGRVERTDPAIVVAPPEHPPEIPV